jgi:Beta-propeller repeat.
MLLPTPKRIHYCGFYGLRFKCRMLYRIKNYIYTGNHLHMCRIDIRNFELIKKIHERFYVYVVYSNNRYICDIRNGNIGIYSLEKKLIISIPFGKYIQGIAIDDNNNILVTGPSNFHIYNLKGELIKLWDLISNYHKNITRRNIAFNKNEIFMVDTSFNRICVFSYEEKLIRFLGEYGKESGNFKTRRGVAIYRDVVFIADSGNRRIQAFTYNGKFIFEYSHGNFINIANILIMGNFMYVDDLSSSKITKLILYD